MGELKVRWLVFWTFVPQGIVGVVQGVTGTPLSALPSILVTGLTDALLVGYLVWVTRRRGPGWIGRVSPDLVRSWAPPVGLLAGGYLLFSIGAEPAWSAWFAPWTKALGLAPPPPASVSMKSAFPVLDFAAMVVLAPVAEETFFRGGLLNLWSRWWGRTAAIAATALVFGFLHDDGQIFKTVLGAGLALLALGSGSLLVPLGAHMLVNSLAFLALHGPAPGDPGPGPWDGPVEAVLTLAGLGLLGLFFFRSWEPRTARPRHERYTRLRSPGSRPGGRRPLYAPRGRRGVAGRPRCS